MSWLDVLKGSSAWDARYDLPLVPIHDNPWTYCGYGQLALKLRGEELPRMDVVMFYAECCRPDAIGFNRWPSKPGSTTSHDEIIGACSLSIAAAFDICADMDVIDWETEDRLFSRLYWLEPYVRACALKKVGKIAQLRWAFFCAWGGLFIKPGEVGPHLRRWLMAERMRHYPICMVAIEFWRERLKRTGLTLSDALLIEPGVPELAQIAGDEWTWPKGPA